MEDLKPPYILRCPSPPFIRAPRTLTPYRRWRRRRPERPARYFFFSRNTKTSVSATDVWFGYPRGRRFKEAENWPDAERTASFVRDVDTTKMKIKIYRHSCNTLSLSTHHQRLISTFFNGNFIEHLQINATVRLIRSLCILRHKILSGVSAIAESSNIWRLTDRFYNGREWSSRVNFYRGISYRRERAL